MPEELYKLPHDAQELNRLDVQHKMWSLMVGDLYPSELSSIVGQLMSSSEPKVMDVGCGSGLWALEMATRFPHSQVIGLDITPLEHRSTPPNFSFKQYDLAQGLPTEYSHLFDIVHCRCVCQHVPDPQHLVNNIIRCLKPGGLALIPDGEWIGFDENRKPLKPFVYDPSASMEENIRNTRILSSYAGWLELFGRVTRSPHYQLPNILLAKSSAMRDITLRECWAPTGWPGKGIPSGKEIGAITYLNMKEFFQTSTSVMTSQGVPPAVVDAWKKGAEEELDKKRHNIWYYVSAIVADLGEVGMASE